MRGYDLPSRRLISQEDASMVERATVARSRFTGSKTRKTAFNAGQLVPFLVDPVLPGDQLTYDVTAYVRMATPLFPLFDNQRVDTHFFFVPMRLVWANAEKFFGAQDNPGDSISYTMPKISKTEGAAVGSLADHMGIPVINQWAPGGAQLEVVSLPFRAYALIFNLWFRDQNAQPAASFTKNDGGDAWNDYTLIYRNKSHDYFTSCLPWAQKFTAPSVSLTGLAPVVGLGAVNQAGSGPVANLYETGSATTGQQTYNFAKQIWDAGANNQVYMEMSGSGGGAYPMVFADLAQAAGIQINTLRQAFLVQQLLERDARGGTRYGELTLSHFDVRSPDARLQRPEYIGGGQTPLTLTPIAQTAPTAGVPVGALGAAGTAAGSHHASVAATEHGYVIGLISVRTELSYQQGLHPMWTMTTRYDWPWPSLAGLGEQAVLRREIFATNDGGANGTVFGYQERYHEWRTMWSDVTGLMRSGVTGTLDRWHLAQHFTTPPALNADFLADRPPMDRVLAAGAQADNQQYLADIMIARTAIRPLPTFGTPVTLGRF